MKMTRVTIIMDMVDGKVINQKTTTEDFQITDNEIGGESVNYCIADTAEVVRRSIPLPVNLSYDDAVNYVKNKSINAFKDIAKRRGINESTCRANVLRNNNISGAKEFYQGIVNCYHKGDMSLLEHLLSKTKNPVEENLIMDAFAVEQ